MYLLRRALSQACGQDPSLLKVFREASLQNDGMGGHFMSEGRPLLFQSIYFSCVLADLRKLNFFFFFSFHISVIENLFGNLSIAFIRNFGL